MALGISSMTTCVGFSWVYACSRIRLTGIWQNSNVVKFFSLLKKDDRNEQMVYYQVRLVDVVDMPGAH